MGVGVGMHAFKEVKFVPLSDRADATERRRVPAERGLHFEQRARRLGKMLLGAEVRHLPYGESMVRGLP